MKKLFLILFIGLLACSYFGCEIPPPPCKATKIQRPALSSDALQWVQVADIAPYFKVTSYDVSGNITSVDTLQGHYTYTLEDKQNFGNTECETIHYQEATNVLSLKKQQIEYGANIKVDNYRSSSGFIGEAYLHKKFSDEIKLDTMVIDTKLYNNVYKEYLNTNRLLFAYAKGVGYIYIYEFNNQKAELIP